MATLRDREVVKAILEVFTTLYKLMQYYKLPKGSDDIIAFTVANFQRILSEYSDDSKVWKGVTQNKNFHIDTVSDVYVELLKEVLSIGRAINEMRATRGHLKRHFFKEAVAMDKAERMTND